MQKTIKVTGMTSLNLSPDQITLTLNLKNYYDDYEKTLIMSNEETSLVKNLIQSFNIDRNEIKTLIFNVGTEYTSYKDKKGEYQRKFRGYSYNHKIQFSFDIDNKLLGQILKKLTKAQNVYDIKIMYSIKDKEEAKNKLLKKAVQNAIAKATIIAEASNLQLGNIVSIDYSLKDYEYDSSPFYRPYECSCDYSASESELDMDIIPEDIKLNDNVTIIFEIK